MNNEDAENMARTGNPVQRLNESTDRARTFVYRTRKLPLTKRLGAWIAGHLDRRRKCIAIGFDGSAESRWLDKLRGETLAQVTQEWRVVSKDVGEVYANVRPFLEEAASERVDPADPDGPEAALYRDAARRRRAKHQADVLGYDALSTRVGITRQREIQIASQFEELASVYLRAGRCPAPVGPLVRGGGLSDAQRSFEVAHPGLG